MERAQAIARIDSLESLYSLIGWEIQESLWPFCLENSMESLVETLRIMGKNMAIGWEEWNSLDVLRSAVTGVHVGARQRIKSRRGSQPASFGRMGQTTTT